MSSGFVTQTSCIAYRTTQSVFFNDVDTCPVWCSGLM